MNIKTAAAAAMLSAVPVCAAGAGMIDASASRQWRQNMVEVEFTLDLDGAEQDAAYAVAMEASAEDGAPLSACTFLDEPVARGGRNRIVWDFGRDNPGRSPVGVKVRISAVPLSAESQPYCFIDVSDGAEAAKYPVRYSTKPPRHVQGAAGEPCQTSEIWFRRISAGPFVFGGKGGRDSFPVVLSNDFYMAVFETTQRQYFNITGKWHGRFNNETCRASRPADSFVMGDLRAWRWPDPSAENPGEGTPIGVLRAKTGLSTLDLPTEARWEYCARAPYGERRRLEETARCAANSGWTKADGYGCGLDKGTAAVGSYAPNAYGLYDMLGNVEEICLDAVIDGANSRAKLKAFYEENGGLPAKDPKGPPYKIYYKRACRGGRFNQSGACTPSYRYGNEWNSGDMSGFRLCFTCTGAPAPLRAGTAVKPSVTTVTRGRNVFDPIEPAGTAAVTLADSDCDFKASFICDDFEVDGDFGKTVWNAAPALPPLKSCRDGGDFPYGSTVKALYSSTALYFGGRLLQPMDAVYAQYDQWHQPVWEDDNVEISLCLPHDGAATPYHYVLNPLGSAADLRNGNREYWTRGFKAKVRKEAGGWCFEMKIPYEGVPAARPVAGDHIGVRICRTVHAPKRAVGSVPRMASYAGGALASFAKTESFARLRFAAPKGQGAAAAARDMSELRGREFSEMLRVRLAAARRRLDELLGCAAPFKDDGDGHPLFDEAWGGLIQMKDSLDGFDAKYGEAARRRQTVPHDAAGRILGEIEGFNRFVSETAYFAWQADPWAKGSPSDRPPQGAGRLPGGIAFEQAGNEREAVCLEFTGCLTGAALDLRIVPLSARSGGTFISCDAFEVYSEPFVRFEGDVITAPLVRTPGNIVTLSPGVAKRVWIVFNSRGVPPGEYATKLVLKAAHDPRVADREIPVSARVWNFALPETKDWPLPSFFYGPNLFRCDETALLRLMHGYHVTHGWTKGRQYWYGLKNDCENVRPSRESVERGFDINLAMNENEDFFRTAKELGMKFVFGWNIPAKVEWYKVMTERMLGMGFDYDEFVYKGLIRDEFLAKHIPTGAAARNDVWNYSTNLWFHAVLLSTPPPAGATLDQIEEAGLPEFYRMWTVIHGLLKDPVRGPETLKVLKSRGAKVWSYQCQRYMQRRDLVGYFRLYPWECRLMGLDGVALYTIFSPEGDDGWDSRDGYDEGLCWRGNDKKPVPTKRLEAFREGLEDVAYMDALEKALAAEKAAGRSHPEIEPLLRERKAIVEAKSQSKIDAWRLSAGRAIDRLSAESERRKPQ